MPKSDDRSLSAARLIDADCGRFESQWKGGHQPRIEQFVDATPELTRTALLRALLLLELELRRQSGESPSLDEYKRRFPGDQGVVTEVFSHLATGATAPLALSDSPTATLTQHPAAAGRSAPPPAFSMFGRFELLEVLGEGGFGMVFRARDPQLDREVAIKIPKEGVLSRPEDRERFIREGQAAATVQHPNLCPVYEAGEVDGRPYIVMALIEGQPLSTVLERSGRIPERSAAATIRKLAAALQAAHQKGIIHRDLKPSNVIIDRKGQPVIMDFGLSRRLDANVATLTQSGAILGTPAYMAPEQALAQAAQIGPATDVYALGMILYEMLAGERPFTGDLATVLAHVASVEPKPPSALRPVDPRLEAICLKAISKNIADRYRSMRELAAALGEYLKATDPAAKTVQTAVETREIAALVTGMQSQLTTLAKKQRGTWWKWLAGSAVTAALVVTALFFFWGSREPRTEVKLKFVEPYLADTSLSYFLDSKPVTADALATPVTLAAGDHLLEIKRQVFVIKQFMFTVGPDQSEIVTADTEYPPPTGKEKVAGTSASKTLAAGTKAGDEWSGNGLGMKFCWCPPGEFKMGENDNVVDVKLTRGFWLGKYELTQAEYRTVMKKSPSHFSAAGPGKDLVRGVDTDRLPVEQVTWTEATELCRLLTEQEQQARRLPEGWEYRLPTEAQWEYASRAGTQTAYSFGDESRLPDFAWYDANSEKHAHEVGQKLANPWGLHDMHGNLYELCRDWYQDKLPGGTDPGITKAASSPALRGGSWIHDGGWSRSSARNSYSPVHGNYYIGFRVAAVQVSKETVPSDADHRAAEWVLKVGSRLHVFVEGQKKDVKSMEELANKPFRVLLIDGGSNSLVDDAGLENLIGLTELEWLNLEGTKITGAGLKQLGGLRSLRFLNLNKTLIDDRGVEYLKGLAELDTLVLGNTKVTDATARHLVQMRGLGHVDLAQTQITDATLSELASLPKLRGLGLQETKITGAGLKHLEGMRSLRNFNLTGTMIGDGGVENLRGLAELESLHLDNTKVTDAAGKHLAQMRGLVNLTLSDTQITDATLSELASLPKLRRIVVQRTKVTDAGVNRFQAALPDVKIER